MAVQDYNPQQTKESVPPAVTSICPHCGRCPTCGQYPPQANWYYNQTPYYYPWNQTNPNWVDPYAF